MTRLKLVLKAILIPSFCLGSFFPLIGNPSPASAQIAQSELAKMNRQVRFIPPILSDKEEPDLSDRGNPDPGRRSSGGNRDTCPDVDRPLIALIPKVRIETNEMEATEYVLGYTVSEAPKFWFYNPYTLTPEQSIQFVIENENGEQVYNYETTEQESTGIQSGIIGFHPSSKLEEEKNYRWYFYIYCNPKDFSENLVVKGWVRRVKLDSHQKTDLKMITPLEQAQLYGQAGVWYEALTLVGNELLANPNNAAIQAEWAGLLEDVGLEGIASMPIQELKMDKE